MNRFAVVLIHFTATLPILFAGDADTRKILASYQAARPSDRELEIFRLDWSDSLTQAQARAAKESRPIFFVATHQLKEAGNLINGHC